MKLKDQHVLITGAARRVARAIAERLAREGARITAHFHQSKSATQELENLFPGRVRPVQADLRDLAQVKRLAAEAEIGFGPVRILVNSASDFFPTPALSCSEEEWDALHSLNLKAQFFLAQACGPGLRANGGVILNIADVNGERPMKNFAPYSSSKAGLLMLTRSLALEWAPEVRVNAISPGAVLLPENYTEGQKKRSIARSLLGRIGEPKDIVEAALFLIGNDYMTGVDLRVDGGRSLVGFGAPTEVG